MQKVIANYNGWKNRATWNVALYLQGHEPFYRDMVAILVPLIRAKPGQAIYLTRKFVTARMPFGLTPDGDRLKQVHWDEIVNMVQESAP